MGNMDDSAWGGLLERVAAGAKEAGVFGPIETVAGAGGVMLRCAAAASAEPAFYRLERDGGEVYAALVMEDRWQSESIESDLMHSGDKIEELIEEELVELGWDGGALRVEHFRSDDMLFTFRSPLPLAGLSAEDAASAAVTCLLGYEACFRQLGDMESDGEED